MNDIYEIKYNLNHSPYNYVYGDDGRRSGWFGRCDYTRDRNHYDVIIEEWHYCRELFLAKDWNESKTTFVFSHGKNAGKKIATFVREAEKRLGLESYSTICGVKDHPDISVVHPTRWWGRAMVRKQLFTILVRAGRTFEIKEDANFTTTLHRDRYLNKTRRAVDKFFNGFTQHNGRMTAYKGWLATFRVSPKYPDGQNINQLVKPE